MLYFFTEKQRKEIKSEYRFRFFNLLLGILSIIFLVGILLLIPTYYSLILKEKAFKNEADVLSLTNLSHDRTELRNKINLVNHKISLLKEEDKNVSHLIKEITDKQISSININVIEITETETGMIIKLQGISNNRESLVSFGNILEDSEYFEDVDFPVSSFTRNSDIPFTLSLKITKIEENNDQES